ncbi:hypothetical protein D3C76_1414700 [compost metagenome]
MRAALGSREHITLGLDGPRTNQHIPMRRAGHRREGRGRGNQFRAGSAQFTVQLGKAQVIADRQTDPANRCVRHDQTAAISIVIGLTVTATIVRHVHVKQVQLVVARHCFAMIIDQQRTGVRLRRRLIHRRQRQRAGHYP